MNRGWSINILEWSAPVLSGLLIGLSFPPSAIGWLSVIALVPLFVVLDRNSVRKAYLQTLEFYTVFGVFSGSWVVTVPNSAMMIATVSGLIFLACYQSLAVAIAVWIRPRRYASLFWPMLGLTWAFIEKFPFMGPFSFPWALLGYSLADVSPLHHLSSISGVSGLTFLIVLVNGSIVASWRHFVQRERRYRALLLPVFLLGIIISAAILLRRSVAESRNTLGIVMVQPGWNPIKWSETPSPEKSAALQTLTSYHLESTSTEPDFIVWPETAIRFSGDGESDPTVRQLQDWVNETGIPVISGASRMADGTMSMKRDRNSVVAFRPYEALWMYDKTRFVPFAERVPGIDYLPWLERLALPSGGSIGYDPGTGIRILSNNQIQTSPAICFESAFGEYLLDAVREGTDWIPVVAQDGWWRDSRGAAQHFSISRLRSIETGRTVAQVTVSGFSGVMLPTGEVHDRTNWSEGTALSTSVPLFDHTTIYVRFGDTVFRIATVVLFYLFMAGPVARWVRNVSERRSQTFSDV